MIFQTITRPFDRILAAKQMTEKSEEYTYFPHLHALSIHRAYLYTYMRMLG